MELPARRDVPTRMHTHRLIALAFLCAAFMFPIGDASARTRPGPVPAPDALPPNARQLCSEHVTGTTMHITWTSYALRETVDEARAFFTRRGVPFVMTEGMWLYSPPPRDRMSLHAADGSYPSCANRPNSSEKSVLIRSRSTG
jgi:hypothetical protein